MYRKDWIEGCSRFEDQLRYFEGSGAFWLVATFDCEGNILDVHTRTADCMRARTLSEKSGVDLSRVEREEVCVGR